MTPCLRCGSPIRFTMKYCPRCGLRAGEQSPVSPWAAADYCWNCGARRFSTGLRCERCGALKEPFPPPLPQAPPPAIPAVGNPLVVALLALAGSLGLASTALLFVLSPTAVALAMPSPVSLFVLCAPPIASFVAWYGAYTAYLGDKWALTCGCAAISLLSGGPLLSGSIVGGVALVLAALERERFLS